MSLTCRNGVDVCEGCMQCYDEEFEENYEYEIDEDWLRDDWR